MKSSKFYISQMRNTVQHYLCKLDIINTAKQDIEDIDEPDLYQCGVPSLLAAKRKRCVLDLTRLSTFINHGDFPKLIQFLDSINSDITILPIKQVIIYTYPKYASPHWTLTCFKAVINKKHKPQNWMKIQMNSQL